MHTKFNANTSILTILKKKTFMVEYRQIELLHFTVVCVVDGRREGDGASRRDQVVAHLVSRPKTHIDVWGSSIVYE